MVGKKWLGGGDVLSTSQIRSALANNKFTSPHFFGVFALDFLPKHYIEKRPSLVVVNTAYSASSGEHWVALFLNKNSVDYFDSYGLPPNEERLMSFISINDPAQSFTFNSTPLQGTDSTTCGKFATLFLYFRTRGCTMQSFIDALGQNTDRTARKLYGKIFGGGFEVGCGGGQICYKYVDKPVYSTL